MTLDASTLSLLVIIAQLALVLVAMGTAMSFFARARRLPEATRHDDIAERLAVLEETLARRQEELREVEQKIAERDRYGAEAEVLRRQVAELKAEFDNLGAAREEIEAVKAEAAAAAGEYAKRQQELNSLVEELERLGRELDPDRIGQLRREQAEMAAELAALRAQLDPLRAERDAALLAIGEVGPAQARLEALRLEAGRYEDETHLQGEKLSTLRREMEIATSDLYRARGELDNVLRDHRNAVAACASLEDDRIGLVARIAGLAGQLSGAEGQNVDATPEDRARLLSDLTVFPSCLAAPAQLRQAPRPESEALYEVSTYLKDCGLAFDRRTLPAFHTALKINDAAQLTVLAGVSGTGKSLLPRRYAEALGIHFQQIAVEPRWDSPQDLLGFYNYVEKKYRATELARLLASLDPWKSIELPEGTPDRRNHMALMLLDEMNLARVEYYFSEFLSRLEARPDWRNGLLREHCKDALIPVDIRGLKDAPSLFPAHNILFVGTMNDDESTQSLSEKVLDRGNVLQFPAPRDFPAAQSRRNPSPTNEAQRFDHWRSWVRPAGAIEGPSASRTRETIADLAEIMQGFGRPFGHRLNQAVRAYVANYPTEGNAGLDTNIPLADQVELRILPRLRGVPIDTNGDRFDRLTSLIRTDLGDAFLADRLEQTVTEQAEGTGLFVWRGLTREIG